MQLDLITDADALAAMRPEWLELLARSDGNEAMRSPQWLLPWWTVFGGEDGRQLRVAVWREAGRLVGLAPMLRRRHLYRRAVPFWRLEPLGVGEEEADEVCSEYLGPIAERDAGERVAEAFADALVAGAFGPCDELVLPAMIGGDGGVEAWRLAAALRRRAWGVELEPHPPAAYIPLPGKYDDYLAALSQQQRYNVRRALRELEKWSEGDHQLRIADDRASLDEGLRVLADLHGQRWRADGRAGMFASERFTRFHQLVCRELLATGSLELSWLVVRGQPVVAMYNIVWDGRVLFYQTGRVVEVPKGIKPGIIGHALAIQRAIAAGHREYDFLAGNARYKSDLALAERPLARLRAVRPAWRERLRRLAERGAAVARGLRGRWRARGERQSGGQSE